MKTGKSIVELATEIQAQAEAKQDYVVDTREITMNPNTTDLQIGGGVVTVSPTNHAHRPIGDRVGIPAKYYDRMREESSSLLAGNVNHWLHNSPERRMVRTLDGSARAFLSDRYRRIDNQEIAEVVLPILLESPEIRVMSSEITERKMYIQAIFPRLEREVKVGDAVQAGITITNSEIGMGGFNISPLVYRLVCLNGMITSAAMKEYHVGRRAESEAGSYAVFTDETIKADDHALMLKVRDVVRSAMDETSFEDQIIAMQNAAVSEKIVNPVKAVEILTKKSSLSKGESNSILTNLIEGAALTKYGMVQAVTAVANSEHVDYDRAIEFQQLGGRVLDLPQSEWEQVARG